MKKIFTILGIALIALSATIFTSCDGNISDAVYIANAGEPEDPESTTQGFIIYTESPSALEVLNSLSLEINEMSLEEPEEDPVYEVACLGSLGGGIDALKNYFMIAVLDPDFSVKSLIPGANFVDSELLGVEIDDVGNNSEGILYYLETQEVVSEAVTKGYVQKLKALGVNASVVPVELSESETVKGFSFPAPKDEEEEEKLSAKVLTAFAANGNGYIIVPF